MTSHKSTPIQLPLAMDGLTVEIPLTRGYVAIVDAVDADLLQTKWHADINSKGVYARSSVKLDGSKGKDRLHCIVMERVLGHSIPKGVEVDHADANGLNCRRSNLRLATRSQNNANQRLNSKNTSGFKGVSLHKASGLWHAEIRYQLKRYSIGYFKTAAEASEARQTASETIHGAFRRER
jgi:hypothetical protein